VGTLEPGTDADLVVWNGEPFSLSGKPEHVLVDGERVAGTGEIEG
jgi:imidazolonepropionase-like amidohydrolase